MPEPIKQEDPKPDFTKQIEELTKRNQELDAKLKELTSKKETKSEDDPELIEKARKDRETLDKKNHDSKVLESAIKFDLQSKEFLKTNETLLPKEVSDIFKSAENEKYENAIQKDAAIKSGIVQAFFKVQANLDLLTPAQKTNLDEYLALTKNGKQDRAQVIYDNIFEPTFEMLKRIKKAEALQKGLGTGGDDDYKNRLMQGSQKHFLGGNKNA